MEYKYSDITEKILRASMNVYATLGNGFQELIYQRSLVVEFDILNIDFGREVSMPVLNKGIHVFERRVDFLINQQICAELKEVIQLKNVHLAQAINFLEAFNLEVGLLINFGANILEWKRIFNNKFKSGGKN